MCVCLVLCLPHLRAHRSKRTPTPPGFCVPAFALQVSRWPALPAAATTPGSSPYRFFFGCPGLTASLGIAQYVVQQQLPLAAPALAPACRAAVPPTTWQHVTSCTSNAAGTVSPSAPGAALPAMEGRLASAQHASVLPITHPLYRMGTARLAGVGL